MGLRKATAERFNKKAIEIAIALGAVPREGNFENEWILDTELGPLYIYPSTNPHRGKDYGVYTIFCRFTDKDAYKRASQTLTLINPFSGKYNFHVGGHDDDLEDVLDAFRQHLGRTRNKLLNVA